MRISAIFLSLFVGAGALTVSYAQNPGARQDAEDAREKLLKASDQLDNIQANSEATKLSVDGMKSEIAALEQSVTKLETENAAQRQQISELQTALDEYKDEQLKSRQKLIDDVAGMIAAVRPGKKKKEADEETTSAKTTDSTSTASNLSPPPDSSPAPKTETMDEPPPKPPVGYYHEVAFGETLSIICEAYRDKGINVTVAQIRKANGLTERSSLKAGQKLFIPRPGT